MIAMGAKHDVAVFFVLACAACGEVGEAAIADDADLAKGNGEDVRVGDAVLLSQDCETFPCDGGLSPPPGAIRAAVVPARNTVMWSNSALIKWSAPIGSVDCTMAYLGAQWSYSSRTDNDGAVVATVAAQGNQAGSASSAHTIDTVSGALGEVSMPYVYAGFPGRVLVTANKMCTPSVDLEWVPLPGVTLPQGFIVPRPRNFRSCTKAPLVNFPGCAAQEAP